MTVLRFMHHWTFCPIILLDTCSLLTISTEVVGAFSTQCRSVTAVATSQPLFNTILRGNIFIARNIWFYITIYVGASEIIRNRKSSFAQRLVGIFLSESRTQLHEEYLPSSKTAFTYITRPAAFCIAINNRIFETQCSQPVDTNGRIVLRKLLEIELIIIDIHLQMAVAGISGIRFNSRNTWFVTTEHINYCPR